MCELHLILPLLVNIFYQNWTRIDFGIMFWKNVVLWKYKCIYCSIKLQWPNTFWMSLYKIYAYSMCPSVVMVMVFNTTFSYIVAVSFGRGGKPEYPEKTTDLPQVTDKLHHIKLNQVCLCSGDRHWLHRYL